MVSSSRTKGTYRKPADDKIAALEQRRKRAGIEIRELCQEAGVSEETYRRMRRGNLAFPRQLQALSMAIRTIERQRRGSTEIFEGAP